MKAVRTLRIVTSDGEIHDLNPIIQITVDNSFHEYDFDGDDILSIAILNEVQK